MFDKRSVEKLHKPKRRETVTDILRAGAARMERYSHPKLLQVRAYARHANCFDRYTYIAIFASHPVDQYALYFTGNTGVQSGGVRGHVSLRIGAGPCQSRERPGVQRAIREHARGTILRTDGQAESPAGHQPSPFNFRQGI